MGWLENRKIPALFAVATLLPVAALCWLGIRTLEQDRDLERQRRRERLDVAARRVAVDIEQDLQQIEARLDEAWGRDTAITERVVDNQIANLRKKIESSPPEPTFLKSVRGIGYRFDPDEVTEE